jgi:hypothetical protein
MTSFAAWLLDAQAAVAHDGDTRLLGGCFRLSRSPRPE